ncbi:15-hydroxyprostaglandin dehydrogenase [Trichonephila clavipes]|uniref:15-hydroxyprostaglandin dehydrogenase n=1 Tax=Trichonephila clavipes TaxID=2585209 RepID=A0A8X7BA79_TRICX|nr:15-hydroxyprostaglandin dehydrogenase [Trichonephila clavipes]
MRDSLDLKNKTIKRIQGVQRNKYWATSIAHWTTSSCNTCRHTVRNELIRHLRCPEADGPTNLEQPTLNLVQSDAMASAVLTDPTHALQGTNRGSWPAMKESENEVGSFEQLLLYVDEHYLAGNCPWQTI